MEAIRIALIRAFNYTMTMGVADIIDILIVSFLIYKVLRFIRKTNSYNLARGLITIVLVLGFANLLKLRMMKFLLEKAFELGLIALVIIFQPELRRLLERMGRGPLTSRASGSAGMETAIAQTVLACSDMSDSRTGALLIFERGVKLDEIMSTGTIINADVTAELLKNMFFNKAPLHDGAVIIRGGRIAAAGCVLPLTKSNNLSKDLGMRHRAGIGLSEQSDAVVVIVSEETGAISIAKEGMLKRHLTPSGIEKILSSELISDESSSKGSMVEYARKRIREVINGKNKRNEENN